MSQDQDRDWQSKLEELEAEINQTDSAPHESTPEKMFPRLEINPSPQLEQWLDSAKQWFNSLPQVGKIAVGIGAVWLSFSVLSAFLHIVSSLISIAVMGFLLYIGYRFVTNAGDNR